MKRVCIRSFSGLCFAEFGLNSEKYRVSLQENTDQKNSEYGHFCNHQYIKGGTRLTCGQGQISQKVKIKSANEKMLSDKDSLNHPENEKDWDKLACSCSKQMKVEFYLKFHQSPKVVKILAELLKKYRNPTNTKPWRSWHKLVFHARMNNAATAIVTKDADVFLLLIHALLSEMFSPAMVYNDWFFPSYML